MKDILLKILKALGIKTETTYEKYERLMKNENFIKYLNGEDYNDISVSSNNSNVSTCKTTINNINRYNNDSNNVYYDDNYDVYDDDYSNKTEPITNNDIDFDIAGFDDDYSVTTTSSFNSFDDDDNSWDYNKDFDYYSDNDNYPLYEPDRDDTCYNNYNDSSYDYSSNNYWDN